MAYIRNDAFLNYAHRGDSEHFPQNTMMSFYAAVNAGCNAIETDVRRAKDGTLVLFHDDDMEKLTGVPGRIADFSWEELSRLTVKKRIVSDGCETELSDRICRFDEFLSHFAYRPLRFAIELKAEGLEEEVCALIREHGLTARATVTSFMLDAVLNVRRIAPEIETGYLTPSVTPEVIETLLQNGVTELCPKAPYITPELVEYWHGLGLRVRAWGVTTVEQMKNMVLFGTDGETCNDTPALTAFLKEMN